MENFKMTALIIYVMVMTITPGPNNIMLTASGATFGFKRTIPHILGIIAGLTLLNILSVIGLKQIFLMWPSLNYILRIMGFSYMIFLGIKNLLNTNKPDKNKPIIGKPFSFVEATFFQILNPKAVLLSLSAITLYTLENKYFVKSSIYIIVVFLILPIFSFSFWAGFGTFIRKFINSGKRGILVNKLIGIVTLGCAVYILI